MDQRNPYAPPQAKVLEVNDGRCTRDGDAVLIQRGSDLPPRCIKCNAPVEGPIKEVKLYWHTPWLYLLVLINILLYAIVGVIVRRKITVSPGLCKTHTAKRRRGLFIFLGLAGTCCAVAIGLVSTDQSEGAIALFLFALLILIIGMLVSRKVYAKKITKEYARIGGCQEAFLASLEGH